MVVVALEHLQPKKLTKHVFIIYDDLCTSLQQYIITQENGTLPPPNLYFIKLMKYLQAHTCKR